MRAWNVWERLCLYGVCGFAAEVIFTATWEAVENGNRKLHGLTSLYAFPIYGLSTLVQERLFLALKVPLSLQSRKPSLQDAYSPWSRGLLYVFWSYTWELSCGLLLRQFDACPWDYAAYFRGHFMGLVTLEYLPVWYVASLAGERLLIANALDACWKVSKARPGNKRE